MSIGTINIPIMAAAIPTEAMRLPLRAVSGELSNFKPQTKATEPIKNPRSAMNWIFMVYFFFFLNISSMRSVTANPPTAFTMPIMMANSPKIKDK